MRKGSKGHIQCHQSVCMYKICMCVHIWVHEYVQMHSYVCVTSRGFCGRILKMTFMCSPCVPLWVRPIALYLRHLISLFVAYKRGPSAYRRFIHVWWAFILFHGQSYVCYGLPVHLGGIFVRDFWLHCCVRLRYLTVSLSCHFPPYRHKRVPPTSSVSHYVPNLQSGLPQSSCHNLFLENGQQQYEVYKTCSKWTKHFFI